LRSGQASDRFLKRAPGLGPELAAPFLIEARFLQGSAEDGGVGVDELIAACRERYEVLVEEVRTTEESVVFKLPRALVA
jgi:hypothetical protein